MTFCRPKPMPGMKPGLANLAATVLQLLGYETPDGYQPGLLKVDPNEG